MEQGGIDFFHETLEGGKIVQMGFFFFDFFPKFFNGIIIRGISREGVCGDPTCVLCKELPHGFGGMVGCPILNQDQGFGGFIQNLLEEDLIGFGGHAFRLSLIKKLSTKIVDQTKDLVAFANPGGLHFGLLTFLGPGIGQRPPLGKRGFIPKEQQGPPGLGVGQNTGPALRQPFLAFVSVVRILSWVIKT